MLFPRCPGKPKEQNKSKIDCHSASPESPFAILPCAKATSIVDTPRESISRPSGRASSYQAVDYVESNCNPNCPTAKKNAQCENPFNPALPVTVIFDSPNLNWCGCATTSSPDPSKQTVGYSGRCSQGAGDYYTKYKDLATQICNRA